MLFIDLRVLTVGYTERLVLFPVFAEEQPFFRYNPLWINADRLPH